MGEKMSLDSKILVLYTGGTIGMKNSPDGYKPVPDYFTGLLQSLPQFHDPAAAESFPDVDIVMPVSKYEKRIGFNMIEYDPLLDSCDLTFSNWSEIAQDIYQNYKEYDAFVIIHGTDTMAYTASALSFMCENLGKTIILTGSQIPMSEQRNDGRENLLGALVVAGHYQIPEVCLFFHNLLFRGNRVTKIDASSLYGFNSLNLGPLAEVGIDVKVDWDSIFRKSGIKSFEVFTDLCPNVAVLRLFPGMPPSIVAQMLAPPMEGVVLQTFGAGNAPLNLKLLNTFKEATDRGLLIVNTTQCGKGTVSAHYETGIALLRVGVVAGNDMTPEATLAKLAYILGKDLTHEERISMLTTNLRGELTKEATNQTFSLQNDELFDALQEHLRLSDSSSMKMLRKAVLPTMICAAATNGNLDHIKTFEASAVHLEDYDQRTPLHCAASEGHLSVVEYFLTQGANIHKKDRWGQTPLMDAVKGLHEPVINLIVNAGGHVVSTNKIGQMLCDASSEGNMQQLKMWQIAGCPLDSHDYDGRTALHISAGKGDIDLVRFLAANSNINPVDSFNNTPLRSALDSMQEETARFLYANGGKLNDNEVEIACKLCYFAYANMKEEILLWIQCGANPNACDYDKRTAIHIANAEKNDSLVQALIKHGADPHFADRWGMSVYPQKQI